MSVVGGLVFLGWDVVEHAVRSNGQTVKPPSQADEAAATLPHSRVVRFPGLGHDVVAASDCGRQIMAEFLNRPDGYQARCADEMRPPTFIG